ncbi:MAG: 16S rRNA (guanine(966)-N(2))-methyltransferase RsmD [Candidatus Eremiobacteraeota bacterium]|nr:16S rRNA (guanine(966)-N(2))-methyltransferase RsmD [Candidatus Eremiobacteraeota bacterium]
MYVIAGSLKGIRLRTQAEPDIRPTSQKVKEALFNILMEEIQESLFLDLFAGFGTIGIEALSRGARHAIFMEKSRKALALLRENLKNAGLSGRSQILEGDATRSIARYEGPPFGIIYMDPPYHFLSHEKVLQALVEKNMVAPGGVIIVEHYHKQAVSSPEPSLICTRREKYGQTLLSFFRA